MILYDTIGTGYNATRMADPYITSRMMHFLLPIKGGDYLDIGCGTENYLKSFIEMGYHFCGIDPSEEDAEGSKIKSTRGRFLQRFC